MITRLKKHLFGLALVSQCLFFTSNVNSQPTSIVGEIVYRIDCGSLVDYKDTKGNVWKADQQYTPQIGHGNIYGRYAGRGNIDIKNTADGKIYQTETTAYGHNTELVWLMVRGLKASGESVETYKTLF